MSKKPRRGRPVLPVKDRQTATFQAVIKVEGRRLIEEAAAAEGVTLSEFVRRAALAAAERTLGDGRKKEK